VPGLENGTLTIDVPTGGSMVDPLTGNPVPVVHAMEVHVALKFNSQPPKQLANSQPPGDVPVQWIEGRVTRVVDPISPMLEFPPMLPERVPEMIPADINGIKGRFYPIDQIPDKLLTTYGVFGIVGEKIWGWFDAQIA
jgi:hypothetical protein